MSLTPSTMLALGTLAPEFSLPDTVTGKTMNLHALKGKKGTIVMFICNHCPFVIHVNSMLVELANTYIAKEIGFIAISSNDIKKYPQDAPELMKKRAFEVGYPFPYLFDESQEIAKNYNAACTPDFYLFDEGLALVYRGQLDGSRPGNEIPLNGSDLRHAIDSLLDGKTITSTQKPSIGCNIKWIAH